MKFPYYSVCLDNDGVNTYLTRGKSYKITGFSQDKMYLYVECDDSGSQSEWYYWRFAPVPTTPFDILDELPIG